MVALARKFFGFSRPQVEEDPYVPGDAVLLKDMLREIPMKWAMLDSIARELAGIAGVTPVPLRPDEQFFPISAELAEAGLRDMIAGNLTDLIALVAPAADELGQMRDAAAAAKAQILLDHIVAARKAMAAQMPVTEG